MFAKETYNMLLTHFTSTYIFNQHNSVASFANVIKHVAII